MHLRWRELQAQTQRCADSPVSGFLIGIGSRSDGLSPWRTVPSLRSMHLAIVFDRSDTFPLTDAFVACAGPLSVAAGYRQRLRRGWWFWTSDIQYERRATLPDIIL